MSVLTRIGEWLQRRELSLTPEQLRKLWGVEPSWTGESVSTEFAMRLSAYYTCVKIIAETIAQCACVTYGKERDGSRFRAYDHWMYDLLHRKWNKHLTAHTAFETLGCHLAQHGNGYIISENNSAGVPVALGLAHPDSTRKEADKETGEPIFRIRRQNKPELVLSSRNVCHVMALSSDGWMGRDPLSDMRESLGFALTAAKQGSMLLKNSVLPTGTIESPNILGPRQRKQLERRIKQWAKAEEKFKPLIIDRGQSFKALQMTPQNLELLGTREFSVLDIVRAFRIPPHMVGILERSIKANIEMQSIEFVRYCMLPWYTRIEAAINAHFFEPARGPAGSEFYAEFLVEELMRGDTKSQNESLEIELRNAALTPDEWRRMRNRPPVPDGLGDVHIIPVNMTTLDRIGQASTSGADDGNKPPEPDDEDPDEELEGEDAERSTSNVAGGRTIANGGRRPAGGNGKAPGTRSRRF